MLCTQQSRISTYDGRPRAARDTVWKRARGGPFSGRGFALRQYRGESLSRSLHPSVLGGVSALSLEQALRGRAGPWTAQSSIHREEARASQIPDTSARASSKSCTRTRADARVRGLGDDRHGAPGKARRSHEDGRTEAAFEGWHRRWDAAVVYLGCQPNLQRCPLFIISERPLAVGVRGARASANATLRAISEGVQDIIVALPRTWRGGAHSPHGSHSRVAQRTPWN